MKATITDIVLNHSMRLFGQQTQTLPGRDPNGGYKFELDSPFIKISKAGHKPRYVPLASVSDLGTDEHATSEPAKPARAVSPLQVTLSAEDVVDEEEMILEREQNPVEVGVEDVRATNAKKKKPSKVNG